MPKTREELRRGVRSLIESTSREMDALGEGTVEREPAPDETTGAPARPILRLVRDTARASTAAPEAPVADPVHVPDLDLRPRETVAAADYGSVPHTVPAAPSIPALPEMHGDLSEVHPRRGVCASYYVNHECWQVGDAFCNQALHVCMLRDCPVFRLHREELERRFAAKYAHLW